LGGALKTDKSKPRGLDLATAVKVGAITAEQFFNLL